MLEAPAIVRTAAQPAAVIHVVVPRSRIQEVMGPGLGEVRSALARQGIEPTGPWFTHHLRMSPESFDFEIGIPVARPVEADGRVVPGELPAATVARTVYQGEFEGLAGAWGEFEGWIRAGGHTPRPDLWERYLVGPESTSDPAGWRTELNRPLAE